ncbi:hypothetical protein EPN96_05795 [bacterium]|nr:MAG: hypothetical protein EPN96_05795 [bacterium]
MKKARLFLVCVLALMMFAGCSKTTTAIRSEPTGATVFVEGKDEPIGNTPFYYDFDKLMGWLQGFGLETKQVILKFVKPGYAPETTQVMKSSGALIEAAKWPQDVFMRMKKEDN